LLWLLEAQRRLWSCVLRRPRYRNRFLNVFPDALDLVRRGIRAGLPVNEALVVAGREMPDPVGAELRRTVEQVQLGVPMIDALQETADAFVSQISVSWWLRWHYSRKLGAASPRH